MGHVSTMCIDMLQERDPLDWEDDKFPKMAERGARSQEVGLKQDDKWYQVVSSGMNL